MVRASSLAIGVSILAVASSALAGKIENSSFEKPFQDNHWGSNGEVFGGCSRVKAGDDGQPIRAADGQHCVVMDVAAKSWNGLWQNTSGGPKKSFVWKGRYLIQGGNLPDSVATFLKVEFYDVYDQLISAIEGDWHRMDSKGLWVEDAVKGTTPDGTKTVRFVIIAGDNSEGADVKNRIYWDSTEAQ